MRLDISIPNLETYVFGPKMHKTHLKKSSDVVFQSMVIQEKIDGTKLTLIRTDKTSENYWENWIVSYKGDVLNHWEFDDLTDRELEEIKEYSFGISQYSFIFKHLKSINWNIQKIPTNTEFSIEFAQNKETLTRTYEITGELFLRTYSPTKYYVSDGKLLSLSGEEETKLYKIQHMSKLIGVRSFPVWSEGRINSLNDVIMSCINSEFKKNFITNGNWNDSVSICKSLISAVKNTPSVLGGKCEGAVLLLEDGRIFKIVQDDQYDKETRDSKKNTIKCDYSVENLYFQNIRKWIYSKLEELKDYSDEEKLKHIVGLSRNGLFTHPKKNTVQITDDVHETTRLLLYKSKFYTPGTSVGLIPISGKPLHLGHWDLIELSSKQNDKVIVFLSTKDRNRSGEVKISGNLTTEIMKDYYEKILPPNVVVRYVESPVQELFYELRWLEQLVFQDNFGPLQINLYSDSEDVHNNFPSDRLEKYCPNLQKRYVSKIGVPRSMTTNISGTEMRRFIQNRDTLLFQRFLPPLDKYDKITVTEKFFN